MKVRCTFIVLLLSLSAHISFSQLYAVVNGTWDNSTTSGNDIWSTNKNAVSGTAGLRPASTDDVYTNGRNISVLAGTCKNLYVSHLTSGALSIGNGRTLTITGTMTGWDDTNGLEEFPMPDAITYAGTTSTLTFTGANVDLNYDPYVIFFWNSDTPLGRTFFNFGTDTYSTLFDMAFSRTLRVQSGTYSLDPSAFINGTTASSILQIDAGATLRANANAIGGFPSISIAGTLITTGAISGATSFTITSGGAVTSTGSTISATNLSVSGVVTSASSLTLSGDLSVNSGGTFNSTAPISVLNGTISGSLTTSESFTATGTLTLNAGGHLSTSYSGSQGWWSGASSPATLNIDAGSSVTFSSNSSQNLFTQAYGNLTLSGSGAKTLTGSGTLNIKGNLNIGSPFNSDAASAILIAGNLINSAAWTPADKITFNGAGSQQVGGTVLPTFSGGLDVNKTGGSLSLSSSINIGSGLSISQGTFDAANYTTTLSGALTNNGTLTFGSGATLGTLVIDGSTTVSGTVPSFGHITVNATRSFSSSGTINVAGDITNNGTFNVTGITMNGSSPQSISGILAVSNLTVRDGADVSNLGTINMSTSGVVTMEGTALFDAGAGGSNTLRLQSSSLSNGARIATLPNPDRFTGNVTVERFLSTPEDWKYLAFPVQNPNVGMIKDDFAVTGNFLDRSDNGGLVVDNTSPSIFYLNSGTWTAVGSGSTVANTSLSNVRGYSVWAYISAGTRLDVDGEIGKGPKSVVITGGDNLVPNPYPSAIDWDLVNTTGANLSSSTIYVRTASGQYASYSGGMATGNHPLGSSWNGQISTGQAFWVLGAGSGTLTFQEDDKTTSTNFVREIQPKDFIRIRLNKDTLSDDVIVHFKENATLDKDVEFDAPKKLNDLRLNISAYNNDPAIDFAINGVPYINCEFTTKLKLATTNPAGNYSLTFEDLSNMTKGYEIELVDKFSQQTIVIDEETSYPFTITTDPATSGADRFEIIFRSQPIDAARQLPMESMIDCESGTVSISIQNSQPGVNYQFGLNETILSEPVVGNGGIVNATINGALLTEGDHSLTLITNSIDGCHSLNVSDAFTLHYEALPVVTAVSASTACGDGSITLVASGAPADGFYHWYESEEATTPIEGVTSSAFVTPELNKSATYFVAAVNGSGCESASRVAIEAVVFHPEVPIITVQGDVLKVAEGLGSYEWYLDDQLIDGANSHTYQVNKSGTYTVNTVSNGCSIKSEGFDFIVSGREHKELSDCYTLYPNPVKDILTLSGPDLGESTIAVFDRSGKQIEFKSRLERAADGSIIFVADFSAVRNGMYLLNIIKKSQLVQLKVIKR